MTPVLFVIVVAALFAVLVAAESKADDTRPQLIQTGLLKWLVTGNWPAKVGAGLLLLGIGALLRYALVHVQVPPSAKLGSGLLIAAVLAAAAFALRARKERHAIYIALAGAAAGVAYLTAYSAYGFFGYVNEFNALAMLALVAVATGAFAVSEDTMSIAILAMVGAYIAPAFALESAGPQAIYGYYLAVSALCLVMVAMRGWRGLIHLSFLFTLAGALFFGWTAKFARSEYYEVMQPLLLGLVVVHLAMPLVERRHLPSRWLSRFDAGYFVLLPLVAVVLTLLIAPAIAMQGALGLALLAAIWGVTAGILKMLRRDEAFRHAVVSVLLLLGALLCRLDNVPWLLIGLGVSVAALAVAPRMGWQKSIESLLCGVILLFGLMHALTSLFDPAPLAPFANQLFGKRLVAATLLGIAAFIAHRRTLLLARVLIAIAAGWFLLALIDELRRLYLDFIPQLAYGFVLGLIALIAAMRRWYALPSSLAGALVAGLILCGWWAVRDAGSVFAWASLLITPMVLLGLALGRTRLDSDDGAATFALALLPMSMAPWTMSVFAGLGTWPIFMSMIFAVAGALASWAASSWQPKKRSMDDAVLPIHFWLVALGLLWVTLAHIERSVAAIGFECLGLAYLVAFSAGRDTTGQKRSTGFGTISVIAAALVIQAMLLRALGPDRTILTIRDLLTMSLPAMVSLMWATLGAGLTWWGTRRASRPVWAAGAALLVASAAKLVLLDFGSLGQLGNILALIAAGLVFLGVAWLAPVPPKRDPPVDDSRPPVGRGNPPPIPPQRLEPTPKPISAAPIAARVKAADGVSPVPNRAVFPAPPPLPERDESNEERERISQAAIAIQARQNYLPARADDPPGNGVLKVCLVLGALLVVALVVLQLRGIGDESERLRGVPNTSVPQPTGAEQRNAQPAAVAEAEANAKLAAMTEAEKSRRSAGMAPSTPTALEPDTTGPNACDEFAQRLDLPTHFVVFATGAYSAPSTGMRIDKSGDYAGQIDVMVSHSRGPVVLMLGAYEPTIWNVSWRSGTKVLGVLVSGYHAQQVTGVPSTTPVFNSTFDNRGPCGYFYVSPDNMASLNPVAMRVFKHGVNMVYPAINGRVNMGDSASRDSDMRISSAIASNNFSRETVQREGQDGIRDAIQAGFLREATAADAQMWEDAVRLRNPQDLPKRGYMQPPEPPPYHTYIVLRPFTFPPGLYGANSGNFLVPKGVQTPRGDPGHSIVYNFN